MSDSEVRDIRERLGMGRTEFALLLGYLGSDENNKVRVRRLEAEDEPHLLLLRYLWLIEAWKDEHDGSLPHWPNHLRIEGTRKPWT